jgi:hypothetical protein
MREKNGDLCGRSFGLLQPSVRPVTHAFSSQTLCKRFALQLAWKVRLNICNKKSKSVPVTGREGPQICERSRLHIF